jgi:hypothetical protein
MIEPPNDCVIKIKWSICHAEDKNLFTRFGQKCILLSHGFTQLEYREDTCAIALVASKSLSILYSYKIKNVPHTHNTHILQKYHFR